MNRYIKCRELESQIIQFAAGLHALKLQHGDKVSHRARDRVPAGTLLSSRKHLPAGAYLADAYAEERHKS